MTTAGIQVRGDCLGLGGHSGDGEKQTDSGCVIQGKSRQLLADERGDSRKTPKFWSEQLTG